MAPARTAQRLVMSLGLGTALYAADLHPIALRIVGQPRPHANGFNRVEGRELYFPQGVAVDPAASPPSLYVADTLNHRVLGWRDASGWSNGAPADLVLGQPDRFGASPNSPSVARGFFQPAGLAVDRAGHLWIADSGNHRILRYPSPFEMRAPSPDRVLGQPDFTAREPSTLASPLAVAVAPSGDAIVADTGHHRVLVFSAGSLHAARPEPAAILPVSSPSALALDAAGRLYVASLTGNRVHQFPTVLSSEAVPLRTLAGNGDSARRGPGTLLRPAGLLVAGDDLLVADTGNHRLLRFTGFARSLDPRPVADAVFGQPDFASGLPNGAALPAASASSVWSPAQLAAGPNREIFVADAGNHRVVALPASSQFQPAGRVLGQDSLNRSGPNLLEGRELSTTNTLSTSAGVVAAVGGLVVDGTSIPPHAYVADTSNHRILGWRDLRSLREGRLPDLVLGQPDLLTALPGLLNRPSGLALDPDGNLWVADTGHHRVLRFPRPFDTRAGADVTLGGTTGGVSRYLFTQPTGVAVHPLTGDLFVADTGNHRVLQFPSPLSSGMAASRVLGQTSFTDAARGVSAASLTLPTGVAVDSSGHLYVADTGNSRVLVFGPLADLPATGAAALATGSAPLGQPDFVSAAGGVAADRLRNPTALSIHPESGDIWVADTGNHRVLRFPPLATLVANGRLPYPAGGLFGQPSFSARTPNLGAPLPGQTSAAGLHFPNALALDPAGNLLVGDANARVLLYAPPAVPLSAATFLAGGPLAPGMLASLFGADLSSETAAADSLPLSSSLGGVRVLVEDQPAALLYVSPNQINFQAPSSLEPGGVARVEVVRMDTGLLAAGGSFVVAPAAAGIFAVLNQDGSPNSPDSPAPRGSLLQIFGTGQGAVRNPPPDGAPAASSPPAETPVPPMVTIGTSSRRDVVPEFSGLAPGLVGVWQINARVPEATVPAARVPLVVRYAGSASNVAFIAVR
jgi:uncharacterized protein (TIGR03437 family)